MSELILTSALIIFLAALVFQVLRIAVDAVRQFGRIERVRRDLLEELLEETHDRQTLCGQCDGQGTVPDLQDPLNWSTEPTGSLMSCPLCKGQGYWTVKEEEK